MAQGLIDRTTLEAATEGVQVLGKVFLRALLREASENGWFVDVTNDTQTFMRPDRDALGMIFGPGGSTPHDVAFTRLGSESYGFMNSGLTYHTDLRVRNMESTVVPHANVKAWGAAGDGVTDDKVVLGLMDASGTITIRERHAIVAAGNIPVYVR